MIRARLDRLITLGAMDPLRRLMRAAPAIPVLMYHSIARALEKPAHPYYDVHTPAQIFRKHMAWLYDHGYQVLTMDKLADILEQKMDIPGSAAVITFDDGFRDFLTDAFPVLQEYGFPSIVYLPTAYIGEERRFFKGRECLTWDEVRMLQQNGVTFGSHTVSHPLLQQGSADQLVEELARSKQQIESMINVTTESFSYPYAFPESDKAFKAHLKKCLVQCGYRTSVTTVIGRVRRGDARHFLKRLPINGSDDPALFEAKMRGGYDWLHNFQIVAKHMKGAIGCGLCRRPVVPAPGNRT